MKIKTMKKTPVKKAIVKKCDISTRTKKPTEKAVAKTVTFTVHADKGKSVYVAGEFNQWNPTAKKMAYKVKDGVYVASLKLPEGTYQYKFVIDGTWCADPENVKTVPNDQGTFNSVITVK